MKPTCAHVHEEVFDVPPDALFRILHTPSAIRAWWGAARAIVMPETDGLWSAVWGDDEDAPEYVASARLAVFEPPSRLVMADYRYRAQSGPLPFQADFETEFLIGPHPEGSTLRVTQDGFPLSPEGNEFLAACEVGWRNTFAGIRRYLSQSD